jgi:hypothetical protein
LKLRGAKDFLEECSLAAMVHCRRGYRYEELANVRRSAAFSASSRLFDFKGETNRIRKKESSAIIPRRR